MTPFLQPSPSPSPSRSRGQGFICHICFFFRPLSLFPAPHPYHPYHPPPFLPSESPSQDPLPSFLFSFLFIFFPPSFLASGFWCSPPCKTRRGLWRVAGPLRLPSPTPHPTPRLKSGFEGRGGGEIIHQDKAGIRKRKKGIQQRGWCVMLVVEQNRCCRSNFLGMYVD